MKMHPTLNENGLEKTQGILKYLPLNPSNINLSNYSEGQMSVEEKNMDTTNHATISTMTPKQRQLQHHDNNQQLQLSHHQQQLQ
jgi:hypothetical protein